MLKITLEKSTKKARTLPQMFDDSFDELPKRSPIIKQKPKAATTAKKVSNLVIDSPVSGSSPGTRNGTPKRAAALKVSALASQQAEDEIDDIENKKGRKRRRV